MWSTSIILDSITFFTVDGRTAPCMALTMVEHLALWAPPVVTLLLAIGYYLWWGKESEANRKSTENTPAGGES